MIKKTLLYTLVVAPLLSALLIGLTVWFLYQQKYTGPEVVFTVNSGDTFGQVNARLSKQGLIANPRLFHWMARYYGVLEKFKPGPYTIPSNVTMKEVLDTLVYGKPNLTSVTIPEGKNMYEVANLLTAAGFGVTENYLALMRDPGFIQALGVEGLTLEGYLFPETYKFSPGTSEREILSSMVQLFKRKVGTIHQGHAFLSPHEVVILASMVEKETGAKEERPQIASVFLNRLRKKMRLESDPTTIYGMWENYKGNIRKDDLLRLTPYNTYKIPALPVGPIANPSLKAIEAVMAPAQTEFLFFVSKNDGRHVFTRNYKDHVEAVNEWQRKKENRSGKSWRQLKQ
ncbi:MAG: endolytic transglycosylase MltG [Bacteriovoracia bacterium]